MKIAYLADGVLHHCNCELTPNSTLATPRNAAIGDHSKGGEFKRTLDGYINENRKLININALLTEGNIRELADLPEIKDYFSLDEVREQFTILYASAPV